MTHVIQLRGGWSIELACEGGIDPASIVIRRDGGGFGYVPITRPEVAATLQACIRAQRDGERQPNEYKDWREFYEGRVADCDWMDAETLRKEIARLGQVGAPSPELLLIHAMRLIDGGKAPEPVTDGDAD